MCKIGGGKIPASPVYAKAPEPVVEEPKLAEEDKGLSEDSANIRAKRKGARALRTDLGIGTSASTGLGIPNA